MDRQQLFEAAKLRIRKMQSDALDEDVRQYVSFALADLERIGVPSVRGGAGVCAGEFRRQRGRKADAVIQHDFNQDQG